ncbi:MAG: 50S ribosomal protein L32 [Deltaproteobacteria bacterium]|nr:50S ribosomal protein L32 [Deltaproteobacteria bacterium]
MAVPVKKTSRSRRGSRRSHDGLKRISLATCPQCNEPTRPHHVCPKCGYYKGREIVAVSAD